MCQSEGSPGPIGSHLPVQLISSFLQQGHNFSDGFICRDNTAPRHLQPYVTSSPIPKPHPQVLSGQHSCFAPLRIPQAAHIILHPHKSHFSLCFAWKKRPPPLRLSLPKPSPDAVNPAIGSLWLFVLHPWDAEMSPTQALHGDKSHTTVFSIPKCSTHRPHRRRLALAAAQPCAPHCPARSARPPPTPVHSNPPAAQPLQGEEHVVRTRE